MIELDLISFFGIVTSVSSSVGGLCWWLSRRFTTVDRRLIALESYVQECYEKEEAS